MPQKKEVPFFGEGLIEYRRDHTIELQGDDWRFYIRSLAVEGGITTTLFTPERQRRQEKVRLDWSNIVNNYGVARMSTIPHIYEEGVSFEERLERMYIWASAIKIYDSLMIDLGKENTILGPDAIAQLLEEPKLPRPTVVKIPQGDKFARLFSTIDVYRYDHRWDYVAPWAGLVRATETGGLMKNFTKLENKI